MTITSNLLKHWNSATPDNRRDGRGWYRAARVLVGALARRHGTTRAVVAGVLAATSPRCTWSRNVEVTRELLAGRAVTRVFRAGVVKAQRIISGAKPLVVLGGDKVRSFYRALVGSRDSAVIDTWMVQASGLPPDTRLDRGGMYDRIAGALRRLATKLRIAVADLQATIWVVVRGSAV